MRSLFRSFMRTGNEGLEQPSEHDSDRPLLIVGLGNPGREHAHNRHNVGFWCANRLARRAGTDFNGGGRLASIAEGVLCGRRVWLAKPRTYVNASGPAVAELLRRYRLRPQDLVVICDDLDRDVGALRVRGRGGHGGHNGLRSIVASIGSEDFCRVRIGIGRPTVAGSPTRDPEYVAAYVLGDPPRKEREALDAAVESAADAVEVLLTDGIERAMGRFNSRSNGRTNS